MSGQQIERVRKGEAPTLLEAKKANEVIDKVNALQNIEIKYGEHNAVIYGEYGIIMQLEKLNLDKVLENTTAEPDEFPLKVRSPLILEKLEDGKYLLRIKNLLSSYPITKTEDEDNIYFGIKGYTKFIKYCGGEGHMFFLFDQYRSGQ